MRVSESTFEVTRYTCCSSPLIDEQAAISPKVSFFPHVLFPALNDSPDAAGLLEPGVTAGVGDSLGVLGPDNPPAAGDPDASGVAVPEASARSGTWLAEA